HACIVVKNQGMKPFQGGAVPPRGRLAQGTLQVSIPIGRRQEPELHGNRSFRQLWPVKSRRRVPGTTTGGAQPVLQTVLPRRDPQWSGWCGRCRGSLAILLWTHGFAPPGRPGFALTRLTGILGDARQAGPVPGCDGSATNGGGARGRAPPGAAWARDAAAADLEAFPFPAYV